MLLRTAPLAIGTLLLTGCPDDGGDDGGGNDDGSTTASETGGTTSAVDTGGTDTGPAGTDSGSTSAPGTDSGSTSDMADSGSGSEESSGTAGFVEPIELFNDGWLDGTAVSFQGGFDQDECWASTYVPSEEHYPFTVDAVRMLVGGSNSSDNFPFTLSLYTVDEDNRPDTELGSAEVDLTGMGGDFDVVNLGIAGIESPEITEGNFAIAVCFSSHSSFPGISADEDGGLDHPDRNWIFTGGAWTQSSEFGLGGDWVMRAVVLPTTR